MLTMNIWIIVTIVSLIFLLLAERKGDLAKRAVYKVIASTGFILTAVSGGAFETRYGAIILVGLALSWFGDVFLLWRTQGVFLAGLVSFLFAHLAYFAAFSYVFLIVVGGGLLFMMTSQSLIFFWPIVCPVLLAVALVRKWLRPHLPDDMRRPVFLYLAVISLMVISAFGAALLTGGWSVFIGAVMFYLSDVSVARDRFVSPGFINGLWGLPLYYGGQLFIAHSVSLFVP